MSRDRACRSTRRAYIISVIPLRVIDRVAACAPERAARVVVVSRALLPVSAARADRIIVR